MAREWCAQCGFDSDLYDIADTLSSQRVIAPVLRAATEELDAVTVNRRPDVTTWSIGEYVNHVRQVVSVNQQGIEVALENPGADLGDRPGDSPLGEPATIDLDRALAGVEREYETMGTLLGSVHGDQWDNAVRLGGDDLTVGWFARHVLHDGLHHLADIGRIRHALGKGATTHAGTVIQINVSDGGVPKALVQSAFVGPTGVAGDRQGDRKHHGRPVQAVCLWSAEVIEQLAAEGHPIQAGCAGENITVTGIDWASLRPGALVEVGAVPMVITAHAVPCAKNARWFSDRDFNRILHDRHPGFSRLYAIPLASATVTTGDVVVVEPVT